MKKLFISLLSMVLLATASPLLHAQHDTSNVPWTPRGMRLERMELLAPTLLPPSTKAALAATLTECRYAPKSALQSIERYLRKYPQDSHREALALYKGSLYLYQGDFNRARHALEEVDETALSGEALAEWKVRLAYSLIQTNRTSGNLRPLFESAARSNSYWGNVARLYLAGEILSEGKVLESRSLYQALQEEKEFATDGAIGYMATLYYEGRYSEAATEGERILRREKDALSSSSFLQTMANSYYRLGNSGRALAFFTPLFETHSAIATAEDRLLYGAALMEEKHYSEAQEVLKPATKASRPTGEVATLYLSRALREGGLYSEAITSYEAITTPTTSEAIREVAMYEMTLVMRASKQSNFGQDVRIAERFLNEFPQSSYRQTMEHFLVEFYLSNTDYAYSWQSLQRIAKKSTALQEAEQFVLNHLLLQALEKGDLAKAEHFLRLVQALPRVSLTYYGESLLLASELYQKRGHTEQATRSLQEFIKLPPSANATNLPEVYYRLGYIAFNKKQFSTAQGYFNHYLSYSGVVSSSRKADTYSRLGDCYFALSNLGEAVIAYDLAIRSSSQADAYALLRKAEILGIRKQYSEQIATLNSLIARRGNSLYTRKASLYKGTAYQMAGDLRKAEASFQETRSRFFQFDEGREASLRLALLYYNTHRSTQAIEEYQRLIAAAPNSQEAQQAFESLKSIAREEGNMEILQNIEQQSKGRFKLSNEEARRMAFDMAHQSYLQSSPEAEERLLAFLKSYPSGADANEARLLLANLYTRQGNEGSAYTLYETLASTASQLSTAQRRTLYQQMATIEATKGEDQKAFLHYRLAYLEEDTPREKIHLAQQALAVAVRSRFTQEGLTFANEVLASLVDLDTKALLLQRGYLYRIDKAYDKALQDFKRVAQDVQTAEGAEALVASAEVLLYHKKAPTEAKKLLNRFIEVGTPQEYWLARGYLLLAEVYEAEGDSITAEGYLKSLQKNYPQRQDDIHTLIAQSLERLSAK